MKSNGNRSEIRVSVDSDFLKGLQERLGLSKSTDVTRVALSLLNWVSDETEHNRMILSTTRDGKEVHRLVMPELTNIRRKQQ